MFEKFLFWLKYLFISCWEWRTLTIQIFKLVLSLANISMPISPVLHTRPCTLSSPLLRIVSLLMFAVWWLCFVVLVYCRVVNATVELYFVHIDRSSFLLIDIKWRTNSFYSKQEGISSMFGPLLPQAHCNVNNSAKAFPYPLCYVILLQGSCCKWHLVPLYV